VIMFGVLIIPYFRCYLTELGLRWLYILLFSFSLSAALTPVLRHIALKLKILDLPGGRKIHEKSTPLLGGVAIIVSFNAALLVNMILDTKMVILLCGGIVVALVGLADDWRGVPAKLKLLVQILVVAVLIYFNIVLTLFPNTTWGYWLNVLFTIIWIVGITNSMNFIDGMDGLATGVAAIAAMFMGIVAFQTDQPFMGWIAVAMMGSCIGFLPYNFGFKKPASIFLGDTGSTFIGFVLAALAVKGDWADNSRIVSFAAPVLIFWIFIYDMAYITIERIITGKVKSVKEWIDYVGTDHIHHRFFALLGDKRKAVLFIYILCITLGVSAIALRYARPIDGILLVFQAFLITVLVSIIEYAGRRNSLQKKD
ncbi:MAG: MraY family glycosyltransferase, partial [Thermodesulfobacteriota bacterium]|nr:MraY family glycosyltransferase [Thermodesulfobacteriota bacterium]